MTKLPVGQRIDLTGWRGGTSGFYVVAESRSRVFEPLQSKLRYVEVEIVGHQTPVCCRITPTFWKNCPELRSAEIGRWMVRRGDEPWPKRKPPRYEAVLVAMDEATARIRIVGRDGIGRTGGRVDG